MCSSCYENGGVALADAQLEFAVEGNCACDGHEFSAVKDGAVIEGELLIGDSARRLPTIEVGERVFRCSGK